MNKFYKLFLILILSQHILIGQNYVPLPLADSTYHKGYYYGPPIFPACWPNITIEYQDVVTGDTTINSLVYKKLFRSGVLSNNCWNIHGGYLGAIRQDTTSKKVFFV